MTRKYETLGSALFPQGFEGEIYFGYSSLINSIWNANNLQELEEAIFLFKMPHINSWGRMQILEKIFQDLTTDTSVRIADYDNSYDRAKSAALDSFTKECRERIGSMALGVFFDAVFDRNRVGFWEHLSSAPRFGNIGRSIAGYPVNPHALLIYLNYFATCSEATKRGHKTKIRKFLKFALDEPLTPGYASVKTKVGVSKWIESARGTLANALVTNGMYEECWDYFICEAYYPLAQKFLGTLYEGDDGLMKYDIIHNGMSLSEALPKICESKELAHIWSVLTRFAVKQGRAQIIRTFDPSKPKGLMELMEGDTGMQTALFWNKPRFPSERIGI